jgi:hypothetical protein
VKGAFVLANEPDLFPQIKAVVLASGGTSSNGAAQIMDESGVLITTFEDPGDSGMQEAREAPTARRGETAGLAQADASVCWVECRSEPVFVRWVRHVEARREAPLWVLDGDGVLWSLDALDETGIVL